MLDKESHDREDLTLKGQVEIYTNMHSTLSLLLDWGFKGTKKYSLELVFIRQKFMVTYVP